MKEAPITLCERTSFMSEMDEGVRLDGRNFLEIRPINVSFGKDYGCCTVSLGDTKVFAQVNCEVVEPRPSRPNEGKLSLHVNVSSMAAEHFSQGKTLDIADEIQQSLNRNIKESRCMDLESLCIMAEESVWQFKVDLTVLNHSGNLTDACNIAAISALKHFHRPDVTVEDDGRVTIHQPEEKEQIQTYIKKIPICLTYGFFVTEENCHVIMDPTYEEERNLSGKLIVGLNPFGELTSLIFPGKIQLKESVLFSCINNAVETAKGVAEKIVETVEEDLATRLSSVKCDGYLKMSDFSYKNHVVSERLNAIKRKLKDEE